MPRRGPALVIACAATLLQAVGCGTGREVVLLSEGQAAAALARTRPKRAQDYRHRALALRALGRLHDARVEARIAVMLEPAAADGLRLLGYLEARFGNAGAALRHFQRALKARPDQAGLRREVARMLLRRAMLRSDPAVGLLQQDAAESDLRQARILDPTVPAVLTPTAGGARGALPRDCPGVPPSLPTTLPPPGRCRIDRVARQLERLQSRYLVVGCGAPRLALRLERAGCARAALRAWQALQREAPRDARWHREVGRIFLALGEAGAAQLAFTTYVHRATDRSAAQLAAAALLLQAGRKGEAARRALDAVVLARTLDQQLEGLRLIRTAGLRAESLQAAQVVLHSNWSVPADQLRARVEAAIGQVARQTPAP